MTDHKEFENESGSILYERIMDFMPQFILHVDPVVHQAQFRGMRLNENQIKVMMMLHHAGKASPGFITHHLNIQKGSLTAVLRNLRHKGLIGREAVDGDERTYRVFPTEEGKEFIAEHMNECERRLGDMFRDMDHEERENVERGLNLLTRYLKSVGGGYAQH